MKTHINTQIRLMAIAVFSVLITGLSSVYLLDSVQRAEDIASYEQQQLLIAALALEEAHTHFKKQVQEWKNLLLRGRNAEDYEKYFASFNKQTDEINSRLAQAKPAFEGAQLDEFKALTDSYQQLIGVYLQALSENRPDSWQQVETLDQSLRGIDRPLDSAFPKLTQYLSREVKIKLHEDNLVHAESHRQHLIWISLCVGISAVLVAVSFWVSIKSQVNR